MPADVTFRRLHDVIQCTTNFEGYHLYAFDLREQENLVVTNDEQAYQEHKAYLKNKKKIEENLEKAPEEIKKFERFRVESLRVTVRQPQGIKIDTFLEKYGALNYLYDYGDEWRFTVTLEETVDDYYFGYPTLLDGAGSGPPEDVGGIPGYEHFLEVYEDASHPDHEEIRAWTEGMPARYSEYDSQHLNQMLKHVHYKKTEWDKINHENYYVMEDKYVT